MLVETNILERLAAAATVAERHVYYGVSWDVYLKLLDDLGDDRPGGMRLTYMDGVLEVMSPKRLHEQLTRLVDMIVTFVAFESGVNLDNSGSMTMRLDSQEKGGEPNSCFYVANGSAIRGVTEVDLHIHPPPDIVLEVDITNPSLDKMKLYAAAGVPEVWRYDGERIEFLLLADGRYTAATHSLSFRHLTAERLTDYVRTGREHGSTLMLQTVKADFSSSQEG